jgi:hypothetical protein
MRIDRIDGAYSSSRFPSDRNEVAELIQDLKYSYESISNTQWTTQDLRDLKNIAEKVMDRSHSIQSDTSALTIHYEVLNRIKDKIQDFIINPVDGLLNPGNTESSPKELWRAIESAFHGPWSLDQELRTLDSLYY